MLYFAYGSNLHFPRIKQRCPSAKFIALDTLTGYALSFSKKSADGTGKATIDACKGSVVYGAIYDIKDEEFDLLDGFEGIGEHYYRCEIFTDEFIPCQVYIAMPQQIDHTLVAGIDYQKIIVRGLKKHKAPIEYIQKIAAMPAKKEEVFQIPCFKEDDLFEIFMEPDPVRQKKAAGYREFLEKKHKLRKNKSCINT